MDIRLSNNANEKALADKVAQAAIDSTSSNASNLVDAADKERSATWQAAGEVSPHHAQSSCQSPPHSQTNSSKASLDHVALSHAILAFVAPMMQTRLDSPCADHDQ
jgi:hypothetical protein